MPGSPSNQMRARSQFAQNPAFSCLQELVLDVEYTMAVLPPKLKNELPHDDWCATAPQSNHWGACVPVSELPRTLKAPGTSMQVEDSRGSVCAAAWWPEQARSRCESCKYGFSH